MMVDARRGSARQQIWSGLLMLLLACAMLNPGPAAAVTRVHGEVEAGSTDNEIHIRINNGSEKPVRGISAFVSDAPGFVTNIRFMPGTVDEIVPGSSAEFAIHFDITEEAPRGEPYPARFVLSVREGELEETAPEMMLTVTGVEPEPVGEHMLKLLRTDWYKETLFAEAYNYHATGYSGKWRNGRWTEEASRGFSAFPREIRLGSPFEIVHDFRISKSDPKCDWEIGATMAAWVNAFSSLFHTKGIPNTTPSLRGSNTSAKAEVWTVSKQKQCDRNHPTSETLTIAAEYRVRFVPKGPPRITTGDNGSEAFVYSYQMTTSGTELNTNRTSGFDGKTIDILWEVHRDRNTGAVRSKSGGFGVSFSPGGSSKPSLALYYGIPSEDSPGIEPEPFTSPIESPTPGGGPGAVADADADVDGELGERPGEGEVPGVRPPRDARDTRIPLQPGRVGPVSAAGVDPARPATAQHIRDWMLNARPPQNTVPGANVRYSPKGNVVGTVPGGVIRSPQDQGKPIDPVFLWNNRRSLDSVDHCTMEEYVVAKLNDQSIGHCKGRYGSVGDLTGRPVDDARRAVQHAGFKPLVVPGSPARSRAAAGTVQKQEPDWRQPLKQGATVRLAEYSSPVAAGLVMPDFKGKSAKEARDWLRENDLDVRFNPGIPAPTTRLSGAVQAQYPAPGSALSKSTGITLTVYGPYSAQRPPVTTKRFVTIIVPDVTGLTATQARQRISDARLKPVFKPGGAARTRSQEGKVAQQDPAAGTRLAADAEVAIHVYGPYAGSRVQKTPPTRIPPSPDLTGKWAYSSGRNDDHTIISREGNKYIGRRYNWTDYAIGLGYRDGMVVLEIDVGTFMRGNILKGEASESWSCRKLNPRKSGGLYWKRCKASLGYWLPEGNIRICGGKLTGRELLVGSTKYSECRDGGGAGSTGRVDWSTQQREAVTGAFDTSVYTNTGGYACYGGATYPDSWRSEASCNAWGCNFGRKSSVQACLQLGASKGAAEVVYGTSGSRANECWLQTSCGNKGPHGNFSYYVRGGQAGSQTQNTTPPPPKPRECPGGYNPYGC